MSYRLYVCRDCENEDKSGDDTPCCDCARQKHDFTNRYKDYYKEKVSKCQ